MKQEKNPISFPVAGLQPLDSHSSQSGGLKAHTDPGRQEERSGQCMGWAALIQRVAWNPAQEQLLAGSSSLKGQL